MDIRQLQKKILNENDQNKKRRDILIENILDLTVNSGIINRNANYILYSENSKEEKRRKIKETEEGLYKIIKNVINIADSLEIPIEQIYNRNN